MLRPYLLLPVVALLAAIGAFALTTGSASAREATEILDDLAAAIDTVHRVGYRLTPP